MALDQFEWIEKSEEVHRSVSQLTSYAGCGEQYRLQRKTNVPQRPAAWFIQGHCTHIAIEEFEKDRSVSLADLEMLYTDSYTEEANRISDQWPDEGHWLTGGAKKGWKDLEDRMERGWWQVLQYIEWAKSEAHLWQVVDMEREFVTLFGGVPIRGFIDQIVEYIGGGYEPRDLKSGTSTPASAVQLNTYGVAVERATGQMIAGAAFVKLANPNGKSEKGRSTQYLPVNLEREASYQRIEFLDQFYRDADRGIKAEIFVPHATDGCERVCGVQQFCRLKGIATSAEQNMGGLLPLTIK